jgi:hypothetical protein
VVSQLQERSLVQPALVLAPMQEGLRGLGTQQQEARLRLSEQLGAGH